MKDSTRKKKVEADYAQRLTDLLEAFGPRPVAELGRACVKPEHMRLRDFFAARPDAFTVYNRPDLVDNAGQKQAVVALIGQEVPLPYESQSTRVSHLTFPNVRSNIITNGAALNSQPVIHL